MDLLIAIKTESKPTRIMYRCNISWVPLQESLEHLEKLGLVTKEEEKGRLVYETTAKGKNLLNYFQECKRILQVPAI